MAPEDLRELLDALPCGVVVLDGQGRVVLANPAARLLGESVPGSAGGAFFEAESPCALHLVPAFEAALQSAAGDVLVPSAGGALEVRVRLCRVDLRGVPHVLLLADDDSRARESERALGQAQYAALRDPLTGLFNRRHLESLLPAELLRCARHATPLSVMIVDADHFKAINDRFGHPVGDVVLVELARVMGRVFRTGDTWVRLGGEEFCAVLPGATVESALRAAERLHRVVRALRFKEQADARVTVSIGIAVAEPPHPEDRSLLASELIARADEAVYEAKRRGRDRSVVAT